MANYTVINVMKKLLPLILMIFAFSLPVQVMADGMTDMEKMSSELNQVSKKLSRGEFEGDDLAAWTKLTIKMKSSASLCVSNTEAALLDLKSITDGLGEAVKGEDAEVTKKRKVYEKEKEDLDKTLAKCNLFIVSSAEVAQIINDAEKSYFKQKYLVRSPHIIELVITYLKNPVAILQNSGEFIFNKSGIREIDALDVGLSIAAVLISIFFGIWLRKKLLQLESGRDWHDDFSENLVRAILTTLSCSAPYLIGSAVAAVISVVITREVEETPFVTELFIGLLLFFLATTTIRLLFSPYPPAKLFIPFSPHIAEALAKRLKVLAILGLVGYLAFYTVFSENIIESNLLLMRNIYSLFFVLNLVWTLQVIISSPKLPKLRYLSMLVILAVLASLVAEWMGYRNLAFSGRRIIVLSFVAFMLFIGIAKIFMVSPSSRDVGCWSRRKSSRPDLDKVVYDDPGMGYVCSSAD